METVIQNRGVAIDDSPRYSSLPQPVARDNALDSEGENNNLCTAPESPEVNSYDRQLIHRIIKLKMTAPPQKLGPWYRYSVGVILAVILLFGATSCVAWRY